MQNPPAYAEVEQFFTTGLIDGAKTILQDWEGWQHTRTTYLLPADMVLVVDEAKTERGSGPASLVWHVNGSGIRQKNSLRLDTARRQASMVWSDHATDNMILKPLPPGELSLHSPDWELLYTSPDPKKLHLATAFRTKESITGEMTLTFFDDTQGLYAVWRNDQQRLSLLHNSSGRYQAHANLGTDGNMVALWEDAEQDRRYLCYQGGQTISLSFAQVPGQQIPTKIGNEETASLSPDLTWQVEDESLVINFAAPATSGCLQLQ
jgi:hypothetical protein